MSRRKNSICVFCGRSASTMDHVPPEGIFPDPKPRDLITVPACNDCNEGSSKDDEYFRAIITTAEGNNEFAAQLVNQKIIPRFRRKPALLKSIMRDAKKIDVYSEGGIYLGKYPAIPCKPQRIQAVVEKIIRGLFWHETKMVLGTDYEVRRFLFNPNFDVQKKRAIASLTLKNVGDGRVFSYRCLFDEKDKRTSCWWLMFYDATLLMTLTELIVAKKEAKDKEMA